MIVWDEHNRVSNIAKHGFDFAILKPEFFLRARVLPVGQQRLKFVGEFEGKFVIVVVAKPLGSEALSVISMRRANKREKLNDT